MDPSEKVVVVFSDQPAPGPIQYLVSPPGLVADQAVRAAQQAKPTSGTERRAEVTRANILSRVERRNHKLATRVQALDKPRAPGPQGQWEKGSETETRTKLVQMFNEPMRT
ncbi:hypothetical protein MCOR07_000593 [Pyricularia oryzae]|uniref:Uncharacterized protein n=1 Tax=Pyricularia grisea TaxID=148305 RepID=A0ABQ8NC08_PYRGI|nr:hypothetical protein MCOR33_008246 [Pyricularia grisea]KAI6391996.1 hypothetical protein MCOR23_008698 [Pyricularia oryzae]KAI6561645.1 hypothetical protein MCOR03_003766 [Pyricularia oryzae]KAI6570078.1 hypothetical protein MCOR09_004978 [Pyricularia oryzae]KAI6629887.1 hypothetical protein MCOR07_000593 [Pyricularia oryzae]